MAYGMNFLNNVWINEWKWKKGLDIANKGFRLIDIQETIYKFKSKIIFGKNFTED